MKPRYTISDYNKQLTLKVGLKLWLVILFFLSPYITLIFSIVNLSNAMELINFVYPSRIDMVLDSIAAIPVFFLVYAYLQKKPTSTDFVRKIWLNGRSILIFSAIIKTALILALYMVVVEKLAMSNWLHMSISIIIILYVYFSQRVKDTFLDFPETHSED